MADKTKQAMPDHDSDPAHTPGDGWVGEGGASHLGPATHLRLTGEGAGEGETDEDAADEAEEA